MEKLSPKEQRFVLEYLIDLNATKAAERAGYKSKNFGKLGYELRNKTRVFIQKEMRKRAKKLRISTEKVLRELALIGFSDIGEILDFSGEQIRLKSAREIDRHARKSIKSFKTKTTQKGEEFVVQENEFQLWDKLAALEKIAKHINLYEQLEPIDVILAMLPPKAREAVRQAIEAEAGEENYSGVDSENQESPSEEDA